MIQGSNMTRSHKGMRKGISLIEMLMAIVLLGVLSTVGFKYYKIYYDTTFAAKQAKIYVLMDQVTQLSGAHDLYETKNGYIPNNINYMVLDKQLIDTPPVMPTVSSTGWKLYTPGADGLATHADLDGIVDLDGGTTANNDIMFMIKVDPTLGTPQDKLDYCNIVSNTGLNTWALSTAVGSVTNGADEPAAFLAGYADAALSTDMFCVGVVADAYDFRLAFIKRVDGN